MSASSQSDTDFHHSTISAQRTRRHRDRVSHGLPVRQYSSPAERAALLATPYSQVDRNQRRRAPRCQQQAQFQAQLVASRFANIQQPISDETLYFDVILT